MCKFCKRCDKLIAECLGFPNCDPEFGVCGTCEIWINREDLSMPTTTD